MRFSTILFLLTVTLLLDCSPKTPVTTTKTTSSGGGGFGAPNDFPLYDDNTFMLIEISTDKTYGYTEKNPINTGGGPKNQRRFLNALAGPEGQPISYVRQSSCCAFSTENGLMGTGLLDIYKITWEGQKEPVTLYLNMYDPAPMQAPVGFTIKLSR